MIRAGLSMGPALIFIRRFVKLRIRSNKITTKIRSKSACASLFCARTLLKSAHASPFCARTLLKSAHASTFTLELCLNPRTLRLFALELCLNFNQTSPQLRLRYPENRSNIKINQKISNFFHFPIDF